MKKNYLIFVPSLPYIFYFEPIGVEGDFDQLNDLFQKHKKINRTEKMNSSPNQINHDSICAWAKTFECRMAFSFDANDPWKSVPALWMSAHLPVLWYSCA